MPNLVKSMKFEASLHSDLHFGEAHQAPRTATDSAGGAAMSDSTCIKNTTPPAGVYSLTGEEYTLDKLGRTLGTTIKHDETTKKIFFINTLLNYTWEDQQNMAFNSPSSTGKSFIALQTLEYFPSEDQVILSYTSPTAFFHSQSLLVDENLSPLETRRDYVSDLMEIWDDSNSKPAKGEGISEWREKRRNGVKQAKSEWEALKKYYLVDLEKQILVFLDQPHDDLLKKLRPLLSHDRKQLHVKITDKSADGGHKTKDIIILGYPTVIFLSVNTSLDAQERTRNLLLSAEVSQPKIRDSIKQTAERLSDRKAFNASLEANSDRFELKNLVDRIKDCDIEEILITVDDRDYITKKFLDEHNHLEPRHMRDFPRLIACIKGHALLNLFNRQRTKSIVWATRHDCDEGYKLYQEVGEANEHDIPPHIYKFWIEELSLILTVQGLSRKEITKAYRKFYKTRIGSKSLKRLIETLGEAGLVYEAKDPLDKRFLLIYPLGGGGENNIQVEEPLDEDKEKEPDLRLFSEETKEEGIGLQDKLKTLLNIFHEYSGEILSEETLLGLLEDPHGIDTETGLRLLDILENQEGLIVQARPGYWGLV